MVVSTDGAIAVGDYMGSTLSIVKIGNGVTTCDSNAQSLIVPPRPASPSGLRGTSTSYAGENDGKITGVSTAMEYSADGTSWKNCTGTEITDLSAGTYFVRQKAADSSFVGDAASVIIASGDERTYRLNVTAPGFEAVTFGYAQPEAMPITILNSGNSNATITGVTVSGGDFTVGGSGSTVAAGGSINTWTIRPNAGLSAGNHTATVTVTYNNNASATANVSFMVNNQKQDAPAVSSGENGKAELSADGSSLTITPDEGYKITEITVNGQKVEIPADGKLTGISPSDTVEVTFGKVAAQVPQGSADVPRTGDESHTGLWLALICMGIEGIGAVICFSRKKRGAAF